MEIFRSPQRQGAMPSYLRVMREEISRYRKYSRMNQEVGMSRDFFNGVSYKVPSPGTYLLDRQLLPLLTVADPPPLLPPEPCE